MKQPVTGSFELIKNLNTSCILNAIREKSLISRADIARKTGLTPATVSNITAELMDFGLIEETERGASCGGRKPVMLSIRSKACYIVALHISSDKIEAAICDIEAEIIRRAERPIRKGIKPAEALEAAIDLINKVKGANPEERVVGIGVCVHGLVKSDEGISVFAPNLGWENVRIGDILETEFGLPVYLENDVRAMTLSESWCGSAKNISDYCYLYVGPGIGGGIVFNNELYKGYGGYAGEFGHMTIEPDGPLCSCGNRGCLQALASENTVTVNYVNRKHLKDKHIEFSDVIEAAKNGDEVALSEIMQSARYIGIEVGNIINAFSPPLIVINGRFTSLGSMFMTEIDEEVKKRCMKYSQTQTRIVFSRLGNTAQLRGASAAVIKELFESPKKFLLPVRS